MTIDTEHFSMVFGTCWIHSIFGARIRSPFNNSINKFHLISRLFEVCSLDTRWILLFWSLHWNTRKLHWHMHCESYTKQTNQSPKPHQERNTHYEYSIHLSRTEHILTNNLWHCNRWLAGINCSHYNYQLKYRCHEMTAKIRQIYLVLHFTMNQVQIQLFPTPLTKNAKFVVIWSKIPSVPQF